MCMLMSLFLIVSCQEFAFENEAQDRAQCDEGYEFKTITRKCESIIVQNSPPKANLEKITLAEDTEPKTIELTFKDPNDDPPLGCDITSFSDSLDGDGGYTVSCYCDETNGKCYAKIKPDSNFFSHGEFSYIIFDRDGRSNEKFVFVEVTSVDDSPSVELNDFSEEARNAVIIARGLGVQNEMTEDSTKTFEFYASDPDGDLISSCEIIETSENIDVKGECVCTPSFDNLFSTCEVNIQSKQNFNGVGEYFTYRVFSEAKSSPRLYSGINSFFINITAVDDPPLICQVSKVADAPECAATNRDSCIGFSTPEELNITPTSHTSKVPIVYLNETTSECFRSYKNGSDKLVFVGSIRDSLLYNSGVTNSNNGDVISYIYGADFVSIEEANADNPNSSVNYQLSVAFDIDHPRSEVSYEVIDIPEYIDIKNCLGYNHLGDDDNTTAKSLNCIFELDDLNYNDHFLADTTVLKNNTNQVPSLRFRARSTGDLKKSSQGPICISFIGGNTNGQATVAYEMRDVFTLSNGPYCYGGYGDEKEYSEATGNICGELGVASLELSSSQKIAIGDTLLIRVSNAENPETQEDKVLTFSDCGETCLTNQIHLDTASGSYKNNYADYITTLARRILDRLRAINDGGAIEAKISEDNPSKVIFRSRTLSPTLFYASKTSSGLIINKIMPYWVYRGDSGVGDLSCVGENGELGNHFIISIEDNKTTSHTIKNAIKNHAKANELIEVFMYGSIFESYKPENADNEWPLILKGGREFSDSFTYQATSGGEVSNIGKVYFSITDINQKPTLASNTSVGVEENTLIFSLDPATETDLLENLYYEIVPESFDLLSENGTLRGCLNLEGSDGPFDLTCEFTPNPDFNTNGIANLALAYRVIDSQGLEHGGAHNIGFKNENDPAFICQYDKFKDAPECGLDGCIGNATPVGRIIPSSHTSNRAVVFYSRQEQTCFKSNGSATANDWEKVVGSIIRDVEINQLQKIVIDNLIIDEGGGANEDGQKLALISYEFPDQSDGSIGPDFLPIENILIKYDGNGKTGFSEVDGSITSMHLGDADDQSADTKTFEIEITPVAGSSGETTLRINFADFVDTDNNDLLLIPNELEQISFAEFKVKLNQVNVTHNGWKNIKALGPKIGGSPYCEISTPINVDHYNEQKQALTKDDCVTDAFGIWRSGNLVDSPNVCSFSETLCNSGKKCIGADHTSVSADEFNAIYKNTSANTCHVAKSQMDIGKAKITGKKAGGIFIYVEHIDDSETNEVNVQELSSNVGKFNYSSLVHLKLNQASTYDQLGTLIAGEDFSDNLDCDDSDASCLLSIDLPSLSETTQELNITSDLPEGLYYIGIKDAYTYTNRGLLLVTFQEGLNVEVLDNDAAPAVEFSETDKTLNIGSNLFISTIGDVKSKINISTELNDSFDRPLFSAFTYKDDDQTIEGQSKTSFSRVNNSYNWVDLATPCSVTQSDELNVCRDKGFGGSCLIFDDPKNNLNDGSDNVVGVNFLSSFYDQRRNICYRLENQTGSGDTFLDYSATSSVKIEWEDFTVGDTSIAGFNVYRKMGKVGKKATTTTNTFFEDEYDLNKPLNVELLSSNSKSFLDDFSTTRHPPLPGTVYYYTVKPVVLGSNGEQIVTNSLQSYSEVRVFSPFPNYSFVHRWIVNKTMCNLMHANNRTNVSLSADKYKIEKDNNFRCAYHGVGMSDLNGSEIDDIGEYAIELASGSGGPFYDIGYDMLVNQSELSCPYSKRQCAFEEGEYEDLDCIGNSAPTNVTPTSINAVYYNRAEAKCYIANAVDTQGAWDEVSTGSNYSKLGFGISNVHLPPISNISKEDADELCDVTDAHFKSFGLSKVSVNPNPSEYRGYKSIISAPGPDVPTRRQQRAFGLWSDDYSHEEIEILENGLSLNSTSRCNTQSANGIDDEFTSSTNPPVNTPETVTATDLASFTWRDGESKLIRSIMTGSNLTKNCQSRFGIQDHVGNLSEWSNDFFLNTEYSSGSNPLLALNSNTFANDFYNILQQDFFTDGLTLDSKSIGIVMTDEDNNIEDRNFVIDSASDIVNSMNIPLGLPIRPSAQNDLVSTSNMLFSDFVFPIGTTSGIETDHLHSDRVYLWEAFGTTTADAAKASLFNGDNESHLLFGGGFRDGGGAGVYFLQLENPDEEERADVGTRCVHQIEDSYYQN